MGSHLPPAYLTNGTRILALDGVRGLAVMAVLCFHTLPIPDHTGPLFTLWNAIAQSCWVGVDLFFILSGFLITCVLIKSKGQPHFFSHFYIRRALRICPLYFAVLAGAILLIPACIPASKLPDLFHRLIENQVWIWTFLQNYLMARAPHQLPGFGHFWTLAIEEQFYVLWPALVYWLSRRQLFILCLLICSLSPFARWFCLIHGNSLWAVRQLTYLRLDSLFFGVLLCLLLTSTRDLSRLTGWILSVAAASLIPLACIFYRYASIPYQSTLTAMFGYTAVSILCATLLYSCSISGSVAKIFCSGILRWFGKYSYAIYVFSVPVILCFNVIAMTRISNPYMLAFGRFVFTTTLSTTLALVSWYSMEAPFQSLKSRLIRRKVAVSLSPVLD